MRISPRIAVFAVAGRAYAAGTLTVPWTDGFGPDGPWQAIHVPLGNSTNESDGFTAMWPSPIGLTLILTTALGGNYSINESRTAVQTGASRGNSDNLFSSVFLNETSFGKGVFDIITVGGAGVNASMSAVNEWSFSLPDGRNHTARAGILGLGRDDDSSGPTRNPDDPPSILQQLFSAGKIASNSFGLHVGSVAERQLGSLILGGYEQNRALGTVGLFPFDHGIPRAFLRDVVLGTEKGGSAFGLSDEESIFKGLGDSEVAAQVTQNLGGKRGSAIVILNPSAPYIYLPLGTCETAASHLPVIWNQDVGLYLWNTTDPQYSRIVNSPAYLGFVLADLNAANITVKVPFKLLNLTLDPPMVPTSVPYFPCKPFNSSYGFWQLGRAFLQAAFIGFNLDQNVTFVAQAPGPDMDQSVLRTLEPEATTITSNPIESFEQSWRSTWKELEADPKPISTTALSGGAIAGIVVGIVALVAIVILLWLFTRWRRRRSEDRGLFAPASSKQPDVYSGTPANPAEIDGKRGVAYETGTPLAHEMEVPYVAHEAPPRPLFELPVETTPHRG